MPIKVNLLGFSRNHHQPNRETQRGLVVTKVVEAAIEVLDDYPLPNQRIYARLILPI